MEIHIKELTPKMKELIQAQLVSIKEVVDYATDHEFEDIDVEGLEALCDKILYSVKYLSGFLDALTAVNNGPLTDPLFVEGLNAVNAALELAEDMIHG